MTNTIVEYEPCGGCGADRPANRCINCHHDFEKKESKPLDSLRAMRNKIDEILDAETQRAADLVMAAISILGEAKLMPQTSLGRGQFLFMIAPEVYEEIRKRSKDLPSKDEINGKAHN